MNTLKYVDVAVQTLPALHAVGNPMTTPNTKIRSVTAEFSMRRLRQFLFFQAHICDIEQGLELCPLACPFRRTYIAARPS